ncbi:MAG: hypothetical protein IH892_04970 [Planctomycetes bacterium]|nr:hypothetical protein [Planctomycetota bacterium]
MTKLPGPIGGLPDTKIHRLLFLGCVFSQVRIACDLPPVAPNLGAQGVTRALRQSGAASKHCYGDCE